MPRFFLHATGGRILAVLAALAAGGAPAPGLAAPVLHKLFVFTGAGNGGPAAGPVTLDRAGNLYGVYADDSASAIYKLTPPAAGQSVWTKTTLGTTGGSPGLTTSVQLFHVGDALYAIIGNSLVKFFPGATPSAPWVQSILYSFGTDARGPGSDGPNPAVYFDTKGDVFGTALAGGKFGNGTIFELTPPQPGQTAWRETVLHSFAAFADGSSPNGALVADASGVLYGTVLNGGGPANAGYVYSFTPPATPGGAWKKAFLWSVPAEYKGFETLGGGVVLDAAGDALGVLSETPNKAGLITGGVFKLFRPAAGETAWKANVYGGEVNANGYFFAPQPSIDLAGNLYTMTLGGGASGSGTILRFTPPTTTRPSWRVVKLLDFDEANGYPFLVGDAANQLTLGKAFTVYFAVPAGVSSYGLGAILSLTP